MTVTPSPCHIDKRDMMSTSGALLARVETYKRESVGEKSVTVTPSPCHVPLSQCKRVLTEHKRLCKSPLIEKDEKRN